MKKKKWNRFASSKGMSNSDIGKYHRGRYYVLKIKSSTPCKICRQCYPSECMEFLREGIPYDVNSMLHWNMQSLKEAIAKLEVVCKECLSKRNQQCLQVTQPKLAKGK